MSDIIVDDPQRGLRESWSEGHLIQAVVLLEDAYSFRSIAHKLSPGNVLKLYRWYWSKWTQRLLTLIVSCQLLLIFVQYPSSLSRTSDLRQDRQRYTLPCSIQLIIEFLCLFIFYVDAIIRVRPVQCSDVDTRFSLSFSLCQVYFIGLTNARKKPWIISYFIVTTISLIDLILSTSFGCRSKVRFHSFSSIKALLIAIRHSYRRSIFGIFFDLFTWLWFRKRWRKSSIVYENLSYRSWGTSHRFKKGDREDSFMMLCSVTILLGIHVYFFSVIGMILFPPVKVFARRRTNEERISLL